MMATEIDQATNLLQFLAEAQRLRLKTVLRFEDYVAGGKGWAQFISKLPDHDAVRSTLSVDGSDSTDLLVVGRVAEPTAAPIVPIELEGWVEASDDPDRAPEVSTERDIDGEFEELDSVPGRKDAVVEWLRVWRSWAEVARPELAARTLYEKLYEINNQLQSAAGQNELLLCAGLVRGELGSKRVSRHLVVAPLELEYRGREDGDIAVMFAGNCRVEDDFVDTTTLADAMSFRNNKDAVTELDASEATGSSARELVRQLTLQLSATLRFHETWDSDEVDASSPSVSMSPMLLLRRRQGRSLVAFLEQSIETLADQEQLPAGLRPLIDVELQPPDDSGWGDGDGALFDTGTDEYLAALPLNETQMQVVRSVTTKSQTVVQGPPGTGKTHTSAALIAHLLALGKRVLITAHTDQALDEIRNKLPDSVKDLAVSSIGNSQKQLTELAASVQVINEQIESFDSMEAERRERQLVDELDGLRRSRASVQSSELRDREREVKPVAICGESRSLADHARWLVDNEDELGWLHDPVFEDSPPLDDTQLSGMVSILRDPEIQAALPEAMAARSVNLPTAEEFAAICDRVSAADRDLDLLRAGELLQTAGGEADLLQLAEDLTAALGAEPFAGLAREIYGGALSSDPAMRPRLNETGQLVSDANQFLIDSGGVEISCSSEPTAMLAKADAIEAHFASGKSFKLNADGTPKTGVFAGSLAKDTQDLFAAVQVDHRPPNDLRSIQLFKQWVALTARFLSLEARWNLHLGELSLSERTGTLNTLVTRVLQVEKLDVQARELARAEGLDSSVLQSPEALRDEVRSRQIVRSEQARIAAVAELLPLENHARTDGWIWQVDLARAVEGRNLGHYEAAVSRLELLLSVRTEQSVASDRVATLREAAPGLVGELEAGIELGGRSFEAAWKYARTDTAVREMPGGELASSVAGLDRDIHRLLGELAQVRAWKHALSSDRIGPTTRADLVSYSQLTKKVGKGTGKHAARFSMEARRTLERVRPAVPAWIMPLYRVWDQLAAQPGQFDVIVVDEASQAGVEAVALQLLAPRMVVIGDDKQVSPEVVGTNQEQLSALATQFIPNDRFRGNWEDANRSLFDDAKMRYGGVITLREHRRCVPPIIEFSNRIAYEPENIRLEPTRLLERDALEPMKSTHVPTGYKHNDVNEAEAEHLVQAVIDCCNDDRYEGKTFGVITLLGTKQQRKIESLVLDKLAPEELEDRLFRVGTPKDFQGSERDVIFASLVVDGEGRSNALTKPADNQRFNVAVSRAKDQFWLFHSTTVADIANPDCLRRRLIEYCHEVQQQAAAGFPSQWTSRVSGDVRQHPFDSLFEQRVFNELVGRGYVVQPQAKALGRRIDLVVHGHGRKLAVECDGDFWHGPDQWQADAIRQRSLEGCGWEFHRIRESEFYLEPGRVLSALVDWLTENEVLPGAGRPDAMSVTGAEEAGDADRWRSRRAAELVRQQQDAVAPEAAEEVASGPEPLQPPEPVEIPATRIAPAPLPPPVPVTRELTRNVNAIGSRQDLQSYVEWAERPLPKIADMQREQLGEAIVEVVRAEGPMTVARLYKLLTQAAGGSRTSGATRSAVNRALNRVDGAAVRVFSIPGRGYAGAWVRAVDQPDVVVRELGPRDVDEVPTPELAAVFAGLRDDYADDREGLYRAVLDEYGLSRLTGKRRELFDRAHDQMIQEKYGN